MTGPGADALVQLGLRVKPAVRRALEGMASTSGQDLADYAASVLSEHAATAIDDTEAVKRIRAEADLKRAAADLARRLSPIGRFNPDVTLAVFQAIRMDERLAALYRTAIASRDGFERNNPEKARVNRTLGGICKAVSGGSSKGPDGEVAMVQVSNEFCFSYTRLHPAEAAAARGERDTMTKNERPFSELLPAGGAGGMDFDKADEVRRALGLDGLNINLPSDFDDPVFSRRVLGLEE